MKKFIVIAVILLTVSCTKSEDFTPTPHVDLEVTGKTEQVVSYNCWKERSYDMPDSYKFGLEVNFADGTTERVPFEWETTAVDSNVYSGKKGTAGAEGQQYAEGYNVSKVRLISINAYNLGKISGKIAVSTIIYHADDNL